MSKFSYMRRCRGGESVHTSELVVTETHVKIIFYFYLTLSVTKLHVRGQVYERASI